MHIGWVIFGVSLAVGPIAYGVPSIGYEGILYSGDQTPYVVDESVPAKTGDGKDAKIGFTISREEFARVHKSTWATSGIPGWPRSEWLYYGYTGTDHDFIGISVTQRARDNTQRYTVDRSLTEVGFLENKNVRRGSNEIELETAIGPFDILDFRATFDGKDTDCIAFSTSRINAAVVIDGYFCAGGQRLPSNAKLARILGSLKAPRFKIDAASPYVKAKKEGLLSSAQLRP